MKIDQIRALYDSGDTQLKATLTDGTSRTLRLFLSAYGDLCYKAKGRSRYGYRLEQIIGAIETVAPIKAKANKNAEDRFTHNLRAFKRAFATKAHPNLWRDLQDGYAKLDVDEFTAYASTKAKQAEQAKQDDYYSMHGYLREYSAEKGIELITENAWKTTTIRANKPRRYMGGDYYRCIENIQGHLDRQETFSYHWESGYDISVSGKMCEDGIYRAWLSREFRGCGNGHYYLLINSNTAIFAEDD